jgi:hypothetical protein
MAKDRFNRFKPINWHSGFKQTGSFIKPEVETKPQKRIRTQSQNQLLIDIANNFGINYNDWENNFLETINKFPFELSDKQKDILLQMKKKYDLAFSDEEWDTWKKIVH